MLIRKGTKKAFLKCLRTVQLSSELGEAQSQDEQGLGEEACEEQMASGAQPSPAEAQVIQLQAREVEMQAEIEQQARELQALQQQLMQMSGVPVGGANPEGSELEVVVPNERESEEGLDVDEELTVHERDSRKDEVCDNQDAGAQLPDWAKRMDPLRQEQEVAYFQALKQDRARQREEAGAGAPEQTEDSDEDSDEDLEEADAGQPLHAPGRGETTHEWQARLKQAWQSERRQSKETTSEHDGQRSEALLQECSGPEADTAELQAEPEDSRKDEVCDNQEAGAQLPDWAKRVDPLRQEQEEQEEQEVSDFQALEQDRARQREEAGAPEQTEDSDALEHDGQRSEAELQAESEAAPEVAPEAELEDKLQAIVDGSDISCLVSTATFFEAIVQNEGQLCLNFVRQQLKQRTALIGDSFDLEGGEYQESGDLLFKQLSTYHPEMCFEDRPRTQARDPLDRARQQKIADWQVYSPQGLTYPFKKEKSKMDGNCAFQSIAKSLPVTVDIPDEIKAFLNPKHRKEAEKIKAVLDKEGREGSKGRGRSSHQKMSSRMEEIHRDGLERLLREVYALWYMEKYLTLLLTEEPPAELLAELNLAIDNCSEWEEASKDLASGLSPQKLPTFLSGICGLIPLGHWTEMMKLVVICSTFAQPGMYVGDDCFEALSVILNRCIILANIQQDGVCRLWNSVDVHGCKTKKPLVFAKVLLRGRYEGEYHFEAVTILPPYPSSETEAETHLLRALERIEPKSNTRYRHFLNKWRQEHKTGALDIISGNKLDTFRSSLNNAMCCICHNQKRCLLYKTFLEGVLRDIGRGRETDGGRFTNWDIHGNECECTALFCEECLNNWANSRSCNEGLKCPICTSIYSIEGHFNCRDDTNNRMPEIRRIHIPESQLELYNDQFHDPGHFDVQ